MRSQDESGLARTSLRDPDTDAFDVERRDVEGHDTETLEMEALDASEAPPQWPLERPRQPRRAGWLRTRRGRAIICALTILALLLGICAAQNVFGALDALAAARDAKAQAAALQILLKSGDTLDAGHLAQIQTRLKALDRDLTRIQADLPFAPALAVAPMSSGAIHALRMASAFTQAGIAGVDAALTLTPHLKGALSSVGGGSGAQQGQALTLADTTRAASDVDVAAAAAQRGLAERAQVRDDDLRRLGLSQVIPLLHKLDGVAPRLPAYLGYARALARALPSLLGVSHPANYLFFDLDSDELRATGGFQGNYAILNFSGGKLVDGVHLHDVYQLDCPASQCIPNQIPDQFSWFRFSHDHFGLRDSNLDPDYPATARLAEQLLMKEHGPAVDGVISITPLVIEQILQVTGPITVEGFDQQVTATNLQELIHYYHVESSLGNGPDVSASQYGTSDRKVFDAALGSALLHQVATLAPSQQNAVFRVILGALSAREVQVYVNDSSVEGVLSAMHLDGAVATPAGDSLFVVDTNVGASYVNEDIAERVTDTVTLDAAGRATHDATITYTYRVAPHYYSAAYLRAGGSFVYDDFVRIIVPASAQLLSLQGCAAGTATQPQHAVWACSFELTRGHTLTLHARWGVPHAVAATRGANGYSLFVQRQTGKQAPNDFTLVPPAGSHLALPLPAPLTMNADHAARLTTDGSRDQQVSVSYTHG